MRQMKAIQRTTAQNTCQLYIHNIKKTVKEIVL
jgi:hypothetical protein